MSNQIVERSPTFTKRRPRMNTYRNNAIMAGVLFIIADVVLIVKGFNPSAIASGSAKVE